MKKTVYFIIRGKAFKEGLDGKLYISTPAFFGYITNSNLEQPMQKLFCPFLASLAFVTGCLAGQSASPFPADVEAYPTVIGTQTIGAVYQFTSQTLLVETAQAIADMGSNTLKFRMNRDYGKGEGRNVPAMDPNIETLTDLASREPSHKRVLDMPFSNYIIWAYPLKANKLHLSALDNKTAAQAQEVEYVEIYEFASYLLKTYNGTGKTFYLGHWEGDWTLLGAAGSKAEPTPERVNNMIAWLNVRQKAVEDAKRETPHQNVQVYNYVEVNLVQKGMKGGKCVTSDVLPKTTVDFVSYSAYDSQKDDIVKSMKEALDYIESKLPPKPGIEGKRVFLGEYGFPACKVDPKTQDDRSRQVMKAGLEWGCPFVLYWEMYNNEVVAGKQRGFWLIDDKNVKQPIYYTHQKFYALAKKYLAEFKAKNSRLPTREEFAKQAVELLNSIEFTPVPTGSPASKPAAVVPAGKPAVVAPVAKPALKPASKPAK